MGMVILLLSKSVQYKDDPYFQAVFAFKPVLESFCRCAHQTAQQQLFILFYQGVQAMWQGADNMTVFDFKHPAFYPFCPLHSVFPTTGGAKTVLAAMVNMAYLATIGTGVFPYTKYSSATNTHGVHCF
jgi:hypothetical protein